MGAEKTDVELDIVTGEENANPQQSDEVFVNPLVRKLAKGIKEQHFKIRPVRRGTKK